MKKHIGLVVSLILSVPCLGRETSCPPHLSLDSCENEAEIIFQDCVSNYQEYYHCPDNFHDRFNAFQMINHGCKDIHLKNLKQCGLSCL